MKIALVLLVYGLFRQTLHKKSVFQGPFSRGVFVQKI